MKVRGFNKTACAVGFLTLSIAAAVHAQTLNGPGAGSSGASPRADIVGTPTVTGTQTVAASGGCSRVDINVTGTIQGTTDDGGGLDQIELQIWDDGALVASVPFSVPASGEHPFDIDASFEGLYATGAAGVGVYLLDMPGTGNLFSLDPFIPTDVPGSCAGQTPPSPVPGPGGLALLLLGSVLGWFGVRRLRHHQV